MANLSSLTTGISALSNLLMVSPQTVVGYQPGLPPGFVGPPTTAQTPPALLFHYEGEQSIKLSSDITDHYVEDNTAVQDQIALKPEIIQSQGFIGELNDVAPLGLQTVKAVAEKLTAIGAYQPELSISAQIAYNQALLAYQTVNNALNAASSAWSSITGSGNGQGVIGSNGLSPSAAPQNKQQTMFQQFYYYWKSKTLFTVQTPWAVFQNMAILEVNPVQDADTNTITTFHVAFKMIRVASTITGTPADVSGQLNAQSSPLTNLGNSLPVPSISLESGLAAMGV